MMGIFFWLNCLAVGLFVIMWRCTRSDVRCMVDCIIQTINSWTSTVSIQYSVFVDPTSKFKMEYFKLKLDRRSIDHRRPSINVRSLLPSTKCVTKETISQRTKSEPFRAKMRNTPTCSPILPSIYLVTNSLYFYVKRRKYAALMRWLSIPLFEMGLGKPTLTLYEPDGFKNTRYINSTISNCE